MFDVKQNCCILGVVTVLYDDGFVQRVVRSGFGEFAYWRLTVDN